MSGPRSLRAAFEACQPLRKLFPRSKPQTFHRSFHTSRNPLLTEPSPSPSEIPPTTAANESSSSSHSSSSSQTKYKPAPLRAPRSVQASYLRPLRHSPIHGHPVCDLQLRSFSVRNVEFMADFAMRAAYYLGLPAKGPTPLPKIVQRWTVLKSNFIHKKSQENFERITLRRLIQIQDGDAEVLKIWLAYLRRYAFWGVGMKANVWEFETLDVAENMDKAYSDIEKELEEKFSSFGWKSNVADQNSVPDWLRNQGKKLSGVPLMEMRPKIRFQKQPHKTESVYN